ncbi:hypothetical protein FRB98_000677, partial [Tulasnella sp. 332]
MSYISSLTVLPSLLSPLISAELLVLLTVSYTLSPCPLHQAPSAHYHPHSRPAVPQPPHHDIKKEYNAVIAECQYQLLQAFTAVRQRPDESLTDFLSHLQIAKDHILASMPADAKASDLLDTLVAFFGLYHLEETKENDEMYRTLQHTTKITLNEQVARETAAAAANESAHHVQANTAKEGAKTHSKKQEGPTCSHCNNAHKTEDCWAKFPEKCPEWMKLKMEFQAAEKAKKQATTSHRREKAAQMEEESKPEESAKMASRSSSSVASGDSADHDWNTDTEATLSMTLHHHWIRDMIPCHIPMWIENNEVVYALGRGEVLFQPVIDGEKAPTVLFS